MITSELKETFDSVKKALSDVCELAMKQPILGKQHVLMTDASFRSAGYALIIGDNPDQNIQSKRKTYAPVAFGSKIFSPAQLKMSIYSKDFWQSIWHFSSLRTFSGRQQNQQLSYQTTSLSPAFSKQRQSHQHSGINLILCCN